MFSLVLSRIMELYYHFHTIRTKDSEWNPEKYREERYFLKREKNILSLNMSSYLNRIGAHWNSFDSLSYPLFKEL